MSRGSTLTHKCLPTYIEFYVYLEISICCTIQVPRRTLICATNKYKFTNTHKQNSGHFVMCICVFTNKGVDYAIRVKSYNPLLWMVARIFQYKIVHVGDFILSLLRKQIHKTNDGVEEKKHSQRRKTEICKGDDYMPDG